MHAKHKRLWIFSSAIGWLTLSGCSGSDTQEPAPFEPPELNAPQAFEGSLVMAGQAQASRYIRNGLYSATLNTTSPQPDASGAPLVSDSSTNTFSQTNTQEAGVDEADRIEFDGSTFYVADVPIWIDGFEQYQASVRVLEQNPDNSLNELNRLPIERPEWGINGLYLASGETNRLAVLSGSQPVYPVDAISTVAVANSVESPEFVVDLYDVSSPNDIQSPDRLVFDGRLLSSRRIDNILYTISVHVPQIEGLSFGAVDDDTKKQNYQKILDVSDTALLPDVRLNEQSLQPLTIEECFIPERATPADGSAQIIHVTKIDMTNPAAIESLCMVAVTSLTYMSENALYLAGQGEGDTYLHRIGLESSPQYEASGAVPGIIGWASNPQLRLSERQDVLRIVTTDYQTDQSDPLHRLFTLQKQGDELVTIGQLPNNTYPDPLGKPGEDVYAVRYVGDRGYIVTFEQIDPLYVVDLTNPNVPALIGELEIPGFSSYLHPINEDFLLGVGQQIDTADIPQNGWVVIEPIPLNEMKVSLFDVRDPANPQEISSIVKEDTYTPVEWDYRALSALNIEQSTRFSMPIERWSIDADEPNYSTNSLMVFDVDLSQSIPSLIEQKILTVENTLPYYIYAGEDRSVLTVDGIYYLRGNSLWFDGNGGDGQPLGPF